MQAYYIRPMKWASDCLVVLVLSFSLLQHTTAAKEPYSRESSVEKPAISPSTGKININTADAQTLARTLKGIGLKHAQAIIEYRNAFGPFKSPGDLSQVNGIGERTLIQNISLIAVE